MGTDLRPRSELRPIQLVSAEFVKMRQSSYLMLDMGFGKTIITLTAIVDLLDAMIISRVLIIAPLLVAEETWPPEIESWEHTNHLDYELLTGSPARRNSRVRRPAEIHIINRENVPWLVQHWGDAWPYDYIVMDEISSYKNHKKINKPSKKAVEKATDGAIASCPRNATEEEIALAIDAALRKLPRTMTRFGALSKVRKHAYMATGLSGTPAPNGLIDLWSQYYLLDLGARLGSKFHSFRSRYFVSDFKGYSYEPLDSAFDSIMEKVKDITLSMKTSDYVDMPEVIINKRYVTLSKSVMEAYKRFKKTLMYDEYDIEAVNSGVLTGKLLQLANGSIYNEDGEAIEIHDEKIGALEQIIEEANGKSVFVAYSYQFDLEKLRKKFPKAAILGETPNVVKRWNAGKINLLFAHPQSAGHGLNLQHGGSIAVWYGLTWSLEYYQQFNKRLHRPGQKETVVIHHILARGTKDEDVMDVLPMKDATQSRVFEATLYADPDKMALSHEA